MSIKKQPNKHEETREVLKIIKYLQGKVDSIKKNKKNDITMGTQTGVIMKETMESLVKKAER